MLQPVMCHPVRRFSHYGQRRRLGPGDECSPTRWASACSTTRIEGVGRGKRRVGAGRGEVDGHDEGGTQRRLAAPMSASGWGGDSAA